MEECFRLLRSKDTMVRLQALSKAQNLAEHLDLGEVTELTDISLDLLKDNNFKVCLGILLVLTKAVPSSGDHFKHQLNALLPGVIERLGDGKQPVREAGRRLLLALMEALTPVLIFDKIGDSAWGHKNWRIREEFTRTCAAALSLFGQSKLPVHKLILPSVLKLLEDSNSSVRVASMTCTEELFRYMGGPLLNELQKFSIRPAQLKEITARLEQIRPPPSAPTATNPRVESQRAATAPAPGGRNQSPAKRAPTAETHGPSQANGVQRTLVFGTSQRAESAKSASTSGRGLTDDDVVRYLAATCEKPVTPIKIYSEKELAKEIEKAAMVLVPEKDWSARMTAMHRLCGLVLGGAAELESFPSLLKQLWEPLSTQLGDRRSSIVKQACHLLMLLAREMRLDFESSAEHFIPSLFKLVVITVLIIAESADSCIKTLLYFCRCARILPKMIETAMRDRAGVLRTKCCGYALLILDQWREAPEIQKTGQLFEDMIRCCVGDALSEVRAIARQCYQVFALVWPDRARRLFSNLDSSTQKLLQEEQRAGPTPRSPPGKEKPSLFRPPSGAGSGEASSREVTPRDPVGTPASVLKDFPLRTAVSSTSANKSAAPEKEGDVVGYAAGMQRRLAERAGPGPYSTQRKDGQPSSDSLRSLTGMLKSASAEDLLEVHKARGPRGHGLSGPMRVDAGGRGPPRDGHVSDDPSLVGPSTPHSRLGGHVLGGGHMAARRVPQKAPQSERDSETESVQSDDAPTTRNSEPARQMGARRLPAQPQLPPLTPWGPSKQENPPLAKASRPQPRTSATSASSGSSRPPSSRDDVGSSRQQSRSSEQDDGFGDVWAFSEPVPLSEALASGADTEGTWTNRVQAFQAVVTSLQQDESGSEVAACFKKVMGLYLAHLGEQHHKVAVAALSSLAEVVKAPSCCRLFEGYLERVLPLVFGRLIDSKDNIRQAAARVLDVCQEAYSGDILLQPLIRSLDEQRSVRAKAAVAEYAATALLKPPPGAGEGTWANPTLLKHWLARLAAVTTEKIAIAKEAGAKALVSVYEHLDSNAVLTLVLGLPIEEQVALRQLLRKYTPRIDEDYNQIQTLSKKKYKVVPANGAPVQTDLPAARGARAASQRSRHEEDVPPAAPDSESEPETVEDSHSEQTTRENRVKQWVEVEARKALAVPPEAVGLRSAGKPTGGTLESVEDLLMEANERAVVELQRRLSSEDQPAVSASNPVDPSAGRAKGYAEMFSERRKSLSGASKEVAGSSGEPSAVDSNSPAKPARASTRASNDPNAGNAAKFSNSGEVAKTVSPAKRVPQGTPKRQAEPSPLERLARGVSAEAIEGGRAAVSQPEAPIGKSASANTPPRGGTDKGRGSEGAVNVLGNRVPVHKLDSFDSDSGSDNGWTEGEGLGGAGLHGKVFQELPDPTRNQRMAALKDVKKACKMGDDALWEKHYWHFYQVVLEALNDEDTNLKERALRVLEKMLTKHGCASDDVAVSVVEKLVVVHRDRTASVSRSAESCLEAVLAQVDPECSLQLLQAMSQSPENRTIVLSISLKQKVIARLSAEELEAHLPSILPELFKQFGSPFPDIRKAVVLCLVEMYMTMGNELIPHLAQLSDMQRRLVSIYAKKISETRSKERHGMEAS